jgi:hypothetical protein
VTAERWKLCAMHAGYLVSDQGRVRRIGGGILTPQRSSRGYAKLHLGRQLQASVHVLVAATFLGPRPLGHHVDHLDFDRWNNAASNLRYLRAAENSVRWAGRTSDGRNVWATPDSPPELWGVAEGELDPLTDDELAAIAAAWQPAADLGEPRAS